MAFYEAPIQNLAIFDPLAFTANDEPLTITTGSKYFLRFPNAQNTENFNELTANTISSSGNLTLNPTGNVRIEKTLNMTGNEIHSTNLIHSQNNQNITIEGKGTGDVILKTSNTDRMTFTDTGDINTSNRIVMNSATSANRNINTSLLGLNENVGVYSSTLLGQIYQSGATQFQQNLVNSGSINFVVKDSGGNNITPFQATSTADNIPSNVNLNMAAGTGIISQTGIAGSNTAVNMFKRSQVLINSNSATGSSTTGLEVYDDGVGGGRGLFILPNSGSSSLGDTNRQNDCCLTSRANQNTNALTLSNWNSNFRNGLRIFTTDISNCGLTLQCGQSSSADWTELAMNYNRGTNTTTTTFNNVINFNPNGNLAPSRRQLTGLGTLSFTDISGNTTTGARNSFIYMDSSLTIGGLIYDVSLNGGYHIFSANDAGGVKTTPIYYSSAITSVSNTFIVRSSVTPSNRFDILTDTGNNTNMRARSVTASTNALININCDSVSAGGVTTNNAVATIAPTYFEMKRPIQLNYSTIPNAMNQIGFQTTTTMASVNVATSANIRNITTYTFADAGTYMINWGIYAAMNTGTATFTNLQFGIANTATNTFDTFTFTYPSFIDLKRDYPTLTTSDNAIALPTSCVYRATTAGKIAYFNYLADYTGGTNIIIGGTYTVSRVG